MVTGKYEKGKRESKDNLMGAGGYYPPLTPPTSHQLETFDLYTSILDFFSCSFFAQNPSKTRVWRVWGVDFRF